MENLKKFFDSIESAPNVENIKSHFHENLFVSDYIINIQNKFLTLTSDKAIISYSKFLIDYFVLRCVNLPKRVTTIINYETSTVMAVKIFTLIISLKQTLRKYEINIVELFEMNNFKYKDYLIKMIEESSKMNTECVELIDETTFNEKEFEDELNEDIDTDMRIENFDYEYDIIDESQLLLFLKRGTQAFVRETRKNETEQSKVKTEPSNKVNEFTMQRKIDVIMALLFASGMKNSKTTNIHIQKFIHFLTGKGTKDDNIMNTYAKSAYDDWSKESRGDDRRKNDALYVKEYLHNLGIDNVYEKIIKNV